MHNSKYIIVGLFIWLALFFQNSNLLATDASETDDIDETNENSENEPSIQNDEEEEDEEDEIDSVIEKKDIPNPNDQKGLGLSTDHKNKKQVIYKTYNKENLKFEKTYWQEIDLKTPPNQGFNVQGKELMNYVIQGIKEGKITVYKNYEKKEQMTMQEILEKLKLPDNPAPEEEEEEEGWGNAEEGKKDKSSEESMYFFPNQVSFLEIQLRLVFHNITSEWTFIRDSVKLMIPKSLFATNIVREVGVIDYQQMLKYLNTLEDAKYRNPINSAADIKFSLAFEQDLYDFNWRVENISDNPIQFINDNLTKEREIAGIKDSPWNP